MEDLWELYSKHNSSLTALVSLFSSSAANAIACTVSDAVFCVRGRASATWKRMIENCSNWIGSPAMRKPLSSRCFLPSLRLFIACLFTVVSVAALERVVAAEGDVLGEFGLIFTQVVCTGG